MGRSPFLISIVFAASGLLSAGAAGPLADVTFGEPVLVHTLPTRAIGGEPALAAGRDGTFYITAPILRDGAADPQGRLWRSDNEGATWRLLSDGNGRLTANAPGGRDSDVAVDAAGNVYFVDLGFDPGGGTTASLLTSTDEGETFVERGRLSSYVLVDRPWVAAGTDGHAVFIVALQSSGGRAIEFRRTIDGAATLSGPLEITSQMRQFGPIAMGPDGESFYAPYVAATQSGGRMHVLVSIDSGATWFDVDLGRSVLETYIFPTVAVDDAGGVYVAWSERDPVFQGALYWTRSGDHGATWTAPACLNCLPGAAGVLAGTDAVFPTLAAGAAGRVALSFLETPTPLGPDRTVGAWTVQVLYSQDADAPTATWSKVPAAVLPAHQGSICTQGSRCGVNPKVYDRSMLDFFEAAIDPEGRLAIAYEDAPAMANWGTDLAKPIEIKFVIQSGGPRFR